jgi:ABC-type branched-subunit amino acid transport system substrate-binding protein
VRVRFRQKVLGVLAVLTLVAACGSETTADETADGVKTARGVDVDEKIIRIGGLFDLSGPLAPLGVPWHSATTAAVDQLNESGRLGDWKVELVVKDHAFNPSTSVAMYQEIKDDVLMIAPSLGTQPTAPLLPRFAQDDMLAFVGGGASTSITSHSIWGFTTYRTEVMRAVDHAVETGGDEVKLGIIYGNEDSGVDSLGGFQDAAEALDAEVVAEVVVEATTDDFTAPINRLEEAGATHVVLAASGASAVGALSTAAAEGYRPQWYGMMVTFLEAIMYDTLPSEVWEDNFLWVHGMPFWGEDRPGMEELIENYQASDAASDFPAPQHWALVGHVQMQQVVAILEAAIDAGDLTPEGVMEAAESIDDFDADGMLLAPVDLLGGGDAMTHTRVLKPDAANKTWTVVGDVKELDY